MTAFGTKRRFVAPQHFGRFRTEADQETSISDHRNRCYARIRFPSSAEGERMAPVISYAKSGDVHVAYHVFGEGPPNLVLAPFFVSNIEVLWESPELARWMLR